MTSFLHLLLPSKNPIVYSKIRRLQALRYVNFYALYKNEFGAGSTEKN